MTNLAGKVLQDDENFHVEIVDWRGKPAVKKTVKPSAPKSRAERILNDIDGMNFFAGIAKKHPEIGLYVPEIYEQAEDRYVREYIDRPVVANQEMSLEDAKTRVEQLAKLLADLDRLNPEGPAGYIGSSNYQKIYEGTSRWANENLSNKLMTKAEADKAIELAKPLVEFSRPRLAHGDMSAYKHAYVFDEKIALIDYENFTTLAARYYDAAWCYTRMYGLGSPELAQHFLGTFINFAEPTEHQNQQLMAVLLQRTVGLQNDAAGDAKKGNDYRDRAKELLDLVLQNDLSLLTSKKPSIKAVIFDCYGVLATEGFDLFRDKYYGDDKQKRQAANKAMDQFNEAVITNDDFIKVIAELAGISSGVAEAFLADNKANKPLFDYIHSELEGKYKIGLLSNVGGDWIKDLFGPEDTKLFDAIVLSYQVGLIKPDPKIYQLAAEKLGVAPENCIYVDDREKHCEGARQAGMQALVYKNLDTLKTELGILLSGSNN